MLLKTYQECLNDIFASYLAVKPRLKGGLDRHVRQPSIVLDVAHKLDLVPLSECTIRITGSKGKGTTSRFIAQGIRTLNPSNSVGLLVSPEEIEHTDRMRVNGECISADNFVRHYNILLPHLRERQKLFRDHDYYSPSGIFLLISLSWFRERGVATFVLEGGRGVIADEVGNIPSRVGVVTSIFAEHLNCLGPTEREVAHDKLSIAAHSLVTVLGPSAARWRSNLTSELPGKFEEVSLQLGTLDVPEWVALNRALAAKTISEYTGQPFEVEELRLECSQFPSFGFFNTGFTNGFYECLISRESIDTNFFRDFVRKQKKTVALVSLPDDKDLQGIVQIIEHNFGISVFHAVLLGTRGYLDYEKTEKLYSHRIASAVRFDDSAAFASDVSKLFAEQGTTSLVVLGTQSFVRLFRRAFCIQSLTT